jgi:hypothetical protein
MSRLNMMKKYPGAEFVSLAKLDGYRFFVNQSGKVSCMENTLDPANEGLQTAVWGILYKVSTRDIVKLEHKGHSKKRMQSMEEVPVSLWKTKIDRWTAMETEEDLEKGKQVVASVLVNENFETAQGLGGLSMTEVFQGEATRVGGQMKKKGGKEMSESDKKLVKKMNYGIVELSGSGCPAEYIHGTLRKWISRPDRPHWDW